MLLMVSSIFIRDTVLKAKKGEEDILLEDINHCSAREALRADPIQTSIAIHLWPLNTQSHCSRCQT